MNFVEYIDVVLLIAAVTGFFFALKGQVNAINDTQKQLTNAIHDFKVDLNSAIKDLKQELKDARSSGSREHQAMLNSINEGQKDNAENQKAMIAALGDITKTMAADHLDQSKSQSLQNEKLVRIEAQLESHVHEERKK